MRILRHGWFAIAVSCLLLCAPSPSKAQSAAATGTAKQSREKKGGKTAPASAVDLNNASQSELESVPGIGASTAKKIIAGRPYSSVGDLSKAGISAKQIQGFSSMVKVGPAAAATVKQSAQPVPVAPTPVAPSSAKSSSRRSGSANSASSNPVANSAGNGTPAPGGGAGMVWVNTETKVFHRQGDKWYGKTKKGKYMTEADAQKAGYHESKEKTTP